MQYIVYHGRNVTDPTFDLKYVGGESAKDQYGPGFYFTDIISNAAGYAAPNGIIIKAKITINRPLSNTRKVSPSLLSYMIKNGDQDNLENFGENHVYALKNAINAYSDDTALDALLTIQHDFYKYDPQKYLLELNKFKYDGSLHLLNKDINNPDENKPNVFVVYNPKNIEILDIIPYEKYISLNESLFISKISSISNIDTALFESVKAVYDKMNLQNILYHGGHIDNLKSLLADFKIASPQEKMQYPSTGAGNIGLSATRDINIARRYSSVFGNNKVLAIQNLGADIFGIDTNGNGIDMYIYDEHGELKPELSKYDALVELDDNAEKEIRILKSDKFKAIGIM